jgi:flagellar assembly factor FliW
MLIQTSRFGELEVDASKVITIKDGLLGFPRQRRFALIQTSPEPVFYWLQSVDDADLAFLVCDPREFVADYQIPIRGDDLRSLEMQNIADNQVLVIVNKCGDHLTANLLGPIVIGATSLKARQFVLSEKKYSTRHVLMPVAAPAATKSA